MVTALKTATTELIVKKGTNVSVREIAGHAGVNHGLIHTYFGSKDNLVTAALDDLNERATNDLDAEGFPPPDLASRRGGELAKVIARVQLEAAQNLFSDHPIMGRWRDALVRSQPDLTTEEIDLMIITSSALGLGWAVFAEHLSRLNGLDDQRRTALDEHITGLVAELGGIPGN